MPRPLEVQYKEVAENPILLWTFDLKTKFIISEKTLIDNSWDVVVQSAKIICGNVFSLFYFLVLMIFSFSIIGKEFSTTQNFFVTWI